MPTEIPENLHDITVSLLTVMLGSLLVYHWDKPSVVYITWPFRLLNTFVHEIGHGLTALFSGGRFYAFYVFPDTSGMAQIHGGSAVMVLNSGYMAESVAATLLLVSLTPDTAPELSIFNGVCLALFVLLYGNSLFTLTTGCVIATGFIYMGSLLSVEINFIVLYASGILLCLEAIAKIWGFIRISGFGKFPKQHDAAKLEHITGLPAVFWSTCWLFLSTGLITLALWSFYSAWLKTIPGIL